MQFTQVVKSIMSTSLENALNASPERILAVSVYCGGGAAITYYLWNTLTRGSNSTARETAKLNGILAMFWVALWYRDSSANYQRLMRRLDKFLPAE